jgi:RIO-like serine/threonine protein kinase
MLVPEQLLSVPLVITVVHVPAAFAQERHAVVQPSAQQVPSWQLPLAHSEPATQV